MIHTPNHLKIKPRTIYLGASNFISCEEAYGRTRAEAGKTDTLLTQIRKSITEMWLGYTGFDFDPRREKLQKTKCLRNMERSFSFYFQLWFGNKTTEKDCTFELPITPQTHLVLSRKLMKAWKCVKYRHFCDWATSEESGVHMSACGVPL